MYLVFTRMAGETYHRRLRSLLLYLCYIFRALYNSFVCSFVQRTTGDEKWITSALNVDCKILALLQRESI